MALQQGGEDPAKDRSMPPPPWTKKTKTYYTRPQQQRPNCQSPACSSLHVHYSFGSLEFWCSPCSVSLLESCPPAAKTARLHVAAMVMQSSCAWPQISLIQNLVRGPRR